jgi:hypothetical protein
MRKSILTLLNRLKELGFGLPEHGRRHKGNKQLLGTH